jgi:hypothetical protein
MAEKLALGSPVNRDTYGWTLATDEFAILR